MKFLDLFAGIGGFRLGMEAAGHQCVGYVEWDKFARKSYEAIHNTEGEWTAHDITAVTDNDIRLLRGRGIDVICGGFPCQAFSVAGKRGGFDDTRGTLFFEIARFAKQIKPRFLFLENVKGLLSHDQGRTFGTILNTLDELGYDAEWQVLNSKNFGVPQNRERVFIIGHFRGERGREVFPIETGNGEIAIKVAADLNRYGNDQMNRIYSPDGIAPTLMIASGGGREPKILDDQGRRTKEHKLKDISPTLRAQSHGNEPKVVLSVSTPDIDNKKQNGGRFKEDGEPMFTLTARDRHGVMVVGNVNPSGNGMNGQVFNTEGLAPTLTTNKGEGPKILRPVRTEYGKEVRKAYENGEVQESRHNMTKLEPREDGISNTITTVQKDNLLMEGLPIKEATKKGYDIAFPGDGIRLDHASSKTGRGRVSKSVSCTIDTTAQQGILTGEYRIRKLTPKECWRLQGFPDSAFEKAAEVNSDSQLYKQAGNSVTVNVIQAIAERLGD